MNRIILHISYLLGHHDCVVVPGLGAFMNHYREAWIDEDTLDFHAPSVSVGFNPEIDYNDWMIADSISRRESISREAALRIVNDEVKAMRYQLENDRELSLGKLGLLRFNGGATPEFFTEISNSENVFSGLSALSLRDADIEETAVAVGEPLNNGHHILSGFMRVAVCFVAVFMAVTFFLHSSVSDDSDTNFASIDSGLSAYALADAIWGTNPPASPELIIARVNNDMMDEPEIIQSAPNFRLDGNDPYLVIVGSFATSVQAEKFMSQFGAADLGLMVSDGNYRVYAASATTLSAAVAAAESQSVKSRFSQAWVLKQ
ncbi:MAG: hypothetical protein K2L14_07895 [Duncaniella sp.]|nr:hypothetical protein [Duncaniella sp.]